MGKDKYKISELASILGVSEVAIRKKIKEVNGTKRYRNDYEVVTEEIDGKPTTLILLTKDEVWLEMDMSRRNREKFYSKNNVKTTYAEPKENVDYIEVEPETTPNSGKQNEDYLEFTKRYIDRLDNVYQRLSEAEGKQLLLEDKANREGYYVNEINQLRKSNDNKQKLITLILAIGIVIIASLICLVMYLQFKPQPKQAPEVVTKIIKVDSKGNVVSTLTK